MLFVVLPSVAIGAIVYSVLLGNDTVRDGVFLVIFGFVVIFIVIGRALHERGQRRKFASPLDRMLFARSIDTAVVPTGGVPPHWSDPLLTIIQQRSLNLTMTVVVGLVLLGCAAVIALGGGDSGVAGLAAVVALAAFFGVAGYLETRRANRAERVFVLSGPGRSEA